MNTETLDKLYLEISQFTHARTGREMRLFADAFEARNLLQAVFDLAAKWEPDSSSQDQRRVLFQARAFLEAPQPSD